MYIQHLFNAPRTLLAVGSLALLIALSLRQHLTSEAKEFYFGWAVGIAIVMLTVGTALLLLRHWIKF